ncbi:MAG: enoyl-CoA hydratase/isomerase family protein [Chloroflexi bacterium]|nr:enoyl-CoA hydratase/isomerase family protein [Chloroflexota bacterium]
MTDILFQSQENIAIITFNRPKVLNAFRRAMFQQLIDMLETVANDDSIHVLLLTGAGRAFSAGIDLEELSHLFDGSTTAEQAHAELDEMQELTRRMVNLPKPIISAINGVAVGVGAEVAIASDIRIASKSAYFQFAEVMRGIFETNGVMHRLPRLIGMGRGAHVMLTGERISAQSALDMGLVTKVVPPDMILQEGMDIARAIASNAPISIRLIKEVLHRSYDLDLESVMRLETDGMLECYASEDMQEGVRAFLEKRAPVFKGK